MVVELKLSDNLLLAIISYNTDHIIFQASDGYSHFSISKNNIMDLYTIIFYVESRSRGVDVDSCGRIMIMGIDEL